MGTKRPARRSQHDRLRARARRTPTLHAEPPVASRSLSRKAWVLPSPSSSRAPRSALHRPRTPRPGPHPFQREGPEAPWGRRTHCLQAAAQTASFREAGRGRDAPGVKRSHLPPGPVPQLRGLSSSDSIPTGHVACCELTAPGPGRGP